MLTSFEAACRATLVHPGTLLSMFPQSKVEGYIGKHGATVPSVRMITLFWPARQFQSEKCNSPLGSWAMPGV